ncbi:methylenetetrahydrofolate--tRNA-(uracil(54)-C(5))-methyltransferase (FADH(2)-oxidizing) TrmFO [Salidesulfovibrio brasiliensis]|uniref:methylenetetrahydrofolate--tRNA-(uracil(54)- C(5))-methyltransferase (FADH(2)-oxidizing) TrmFO n=1 Tax=Salidesulfovibrio brasiliensis TaxID=221711 RepID=UPI0034E1949A
MRHEQYSGFPAGIQQIHSVNNDTREFGVKKVAVVGGGLAGSECAWRLAEAGVSVTLFEMKPKKYSEAHEQDGLAELICSNSFRSSEPGTGIGLLHAEMRELGSLVMQAADETSVPAGKALAVDRALFSAYITERIESHANIELVRDEIVSLDDERLAGFDAVCVTAGPLASQSLADSLVEAIGGKGLYFYDAIAPIVSRDSIDFSKAFWGSRWRPEDDDYLNCPMNEEEYKAFVQALLDGEKVQPHEFEKAIHFEGCLPVEEMARRGEMTLAFGPLKPVGLTNPHSEEKPFAVIQLRAENRDKTAFNLVGFQTKLKYPEQKRIFRMIPGLENAEFLRLGSIHRNTYVNAPEVLTDELELKARPGVYLAGQITGVEGYLESAACGLWLGMLLGARFADRELTHPPRETALGALMGHLQTEPVKRFQPSNINFGLMPGLKKRIPKKFRKEKYAERAQAAFEEWMGIIG